MSISDDNRQAWFVRLQDKAVTSEKNWSVALVLSVFLGAFGADRFYLGYGVLGLLKRGTIGGFGVWWLLDIFLLLTNTLRDADRGSLRSPFHK